MSGSNFEFPAIPAKFSENIIKVAKYADLLGNVFLNTIECGRIVAECLRSERCRSMEIL